MNDTHDPDWLRQGLDHIWLPYAQMKTAGLPLPVVETRGARLILADGRELIDGCASWWTACHGYNHPHIIDAIQRQAARMPHVMSGGLANEPAYTLAHRLAALLPGDLNRVFFAESGSVSVEIAMKMALQYWINKGEQGRSKFASFQHGYHGDTLGAMSVCDPEEGMHHMFKGALQEQHILEIPGDEESRKNLDDFLAHHKNQLAAVMVEPLVQAAGGFKFHDEDTLRFIREATQRHDVLLIFDEIMTGFGRTGTLFACQAADVVPDIITLSKALAGGVLPLSATIPSDRVTDAFLSDSDEAAFMHGPTFMGNPLACAAAHASLDLFETEPRLEQVAAIESHLNKTLSKVRDINSVVDVRVRGAIGVIQLSEIDDLDWLKTQFVDRGVFIRPLGDVIYLTPAFTIGEDELSQLTDAVIDVTREWSRR